MAGLSGPRSLKSLVTASLACVSIGLGACAPQVEPAESGGVPGGPMDSGEIVSPRQGETSTMPAEDVPVLPPEHLLAPVLADAGERSELAAEELEVTGSWRRTWSDGSMGCPQPGMHYTQALVSGWQVIVQAGERSLDYRLSDRGYFTLCPNGVESGADLTIER